ncbi:uncharacterized protein F4812DRAFT_454558 [Daldinia caldariorum]|uniref:uncharacterized protein n=1 Tax=Daldinia caldariorum TaxID=326644 RepID=UPI002007F029|nr:uncharacterized protein F4812DRAFT_454558 [Daldinia caldariorum]KAI1472744.1 hypothetical protein F4812DRAFT_454558 [Daldinia caldariorum]
MNDSGHKLKDLGTGCASDWKILLISDLAWIEKKLNKFICEVRAGYREGYVVTTPDVVETIDSPDVWAQLRRELEDIDISPTITEEHHDCISNWMNWSALSMCPYGGHLAIARLLLEHSADLYNVDVDGDTPMQIATTRGHSEVVILFDEAQAERDRLARELDDEPTAK